MARIATTVHGLGSVHEDELTLLDVPYPSLEAALTAGESLQSLAKAPVRERRPLDPADLRAAVSAPSKIWIVGWAYHDHRVETGREAPTGEPAVALVAPSSVTGPYQPVRLPRVAPDRVDYEGEVAVVIGSTASDVSEKRAFDHVAGLTVANDVSARDVQKGELPGWPANPSMAKSFDTFKPLGPAVVSLDEAGDPADLLLRTWVDGELRQEARTAQLIWSIPYLISHLSRVTTLLPGDVVLTGTPGGVGQKTGRYLKAGSVVRVEVQNVGAIENTVTEPGGVEAA
ncbi:fumarylacetoacetate hydrolase family protein [Streptomyces justiciae]|uniref:fumarylacetoacetate hydrolase family protein n=1 Tax=Streptomyces justiciae TaxID=2780140 RepID=UPI0021191AFF|nr:fumarylacetoacetate hydrolase family protein [Streptomyces justiciae]MCW8378655.1 fumarylacetoacetate hydrolase family protein [Streptomyces justiciae]